MKAGWQVKPLGELCDILDNLRKPITKSLRTQGIYPYYGATGILDYVEDFLFDELLVLVGEDGAKWASGENTAFPVKEKCWVNNHAHVLRPHRNKVIDKWLINYLVHSDLSPFVSGLTVPKLNQGNLREIPVPIPSVHEQERIVAILDQAFKGIAKARVNAEQNLQNARALFESHLQSVFTQRGEGWVKKKLGETSILKIIDGDRGVNYPSKEEFSDDGFCLFLNTKNVRPDGFNFDITMFISEEKDKVLRNGKLQRQDVILTTRGTIGNVAVFDENVEFENIRINSGMLIFRPSKDKLLSSFLFEVFRSGIMKDQMIRHVSGAAQPQLPIKTLIDFEIPVPDTLESQREIVASVREIDAETRRLGAIYQRKLTLLDELKKSLLQQAFAGEL